MEDAPNETIELYTDEFIEQFPQDEDEFGSYDVMLRFAKFVIDRYIEEHNNAI